MSVHRYCDGISRRDFIKVGALGFVGLSMADLFRLQAAYGAETAPARSVILLWMDGGPPQHETFDPKPEAPADVRGEFKAIKTNVSGVEIGELMPLMAKQMDKVALIRTLAHNEGAHERAAHTLLTGWHPLPSLVYPSMGSVVAKELGGVGPMPPYVAIPGSGFGSGYGQSGYLEAAFNPFAVGGDPNSKNFTVRDVSMPKNLTLERLDRRRTLLQALDSTFKRFEEMPEAKSRDAFYERAYDMISSPEAKKAFDVAQEPDKVRETYGRTTVGQSCLLARRLVEAGVRFVTVSMGGWDTHSDNFNSCKKELVPPLDKALAALVQDLHDRGLLASTLVVWMGEFGRTPKINSLAGRDHWPQTGCAIVAGAGVKGGQAIGVTDARGGTPKERKVAPEDLVATIYQKLGVDTRKEYMTPQLRPVKILAEGEVMKELV
jgi:Protein of unknown function (DUF1501)